MNRTALLGVVLLAVGLAGYVAGIALQYPGRGFSIAAVMVGLALAAIAGPPEEAGSS